MAEYDVVLEHVSKTFPGGARAVIDFNAELKHGEFVAMLGPSGCGKTTTLRMIGGLEEVTDGKVFIAGKDVTDLPPALRDTSMMFQSFALFPHRTVFQNVEFSLKMRGMAPAERDRRVWEMLEMVGLATFATRRPRELSGGQQQRVALARALVLRPSVLLLDEPLGALDLKLRREMQLELKQLQTEVGITFIYVTHDQEEALTMSDRIVLMRSGRIEQVGSPREMYDCPRSRYVADFIGETNLLRVQVAGETVDISVRPEHVELSGTGIPGIVNAVTFVGSTYRVRVTLSDGQAVTTHQVTPPAIGQSVFVRWDARRGVIVRE
jgi:ABC-type Fe3+/spermidine/putrescine transport system ATPase subunit